jgi:hypothetical protein
MKTRFGDAEVAAGLDFNTAEIVYESEAARDNPVTETIPAVVESDAAPDRDPVPPVTVTVS